MPQPRNAAVKIQAQRERAQHLIALKESPSYPILKAIVEADIQRELDKFVNTPIVTEQGLDYARGQIFGMRKVLRIIEKGEQQLELSIKAARHMEAEEGVT